MVVSPPVLKWEARPATSASLITAESMTGAVAYPKENTMACDDFARSDCFMSKGGRIPTFFLIDRGVIHGFQY